MSTPRILGYPSAQLQALISRLLLGEFDHCYTLAQCFAGQAVIHVESNSACELACGTRYGLDDAEWKLTHNEKLEVWCHPCLIKLLMANSEPAWGDSG
ncbi:MAG: hypothetical protein ACTSX8_03535 [Alphaproteobacteria bacterium]